MPKYRYALLLLLCTIVLRSTALHWAALEEDEAQHFVAGVELAHGGLPYLSIVDGKTPLLWYFFAFVAKVAGPFNTVALRFFTDGFVWITSLLLWRLGSLLQSARAGRWAALLFTLFSTCSSYKILSSNFELHFLPFDLLAYLLLTLSFLRQRPWYALGGGAAIATAFFIKQTAGITLATQVMFCLLMALATPWRRLALTTLGTLVAGFAITVGLYVGWMASLGLLDQLIFWIWNYAWYMTTFTAAKIPFLPRLLSRGGSWLAGTFVVHLWAILWIVRVWQPPRLSRQDLSLQSCLEGLLPLWVLFTWFPICLGGRFPLHYFLMYLPPLSLMAGFWIGRAATVESFFVDRCGGWRWARRVILFAFPVVAMFIVNWNIPWCNRVYGLRRADHAKLARHIQAATTPTDRIFVWGDNPEFYVFAQRRPASRFVWVDYLVGRFSVPSNLIGDPLLYDRMILPKTWHLLFEDFAAHPPQLIVDTSPADLHDFKVFPISRYPELAQYVATHYHLGWVEDDVHFYVRTAIP